MGSTHGDIACFLSRSEVFRHATEAQISQLAGQCRIQHYTPNQIVFGSREPATDVLLVVRGTVKLFDVTRDGKEAILDFALPGQVFGELAVLGESRGEYAEAVDAARIVHVPSRSLKQLMEQAPSVAAELTRLTAGRTRRFEGRLKSFLFANHRDRVVEVLAELARTHGIKTRQSVLIPLPLRQQDIAGMVGSARETANLVLGELRQEGHLRFQHQRMEVLSPN